MKIAVEGCCHGELDKIYETLQYLEKKENVKVDLLLICGDFQAVRNKSDLQAMAVPQKYQKMNTFWKYYSGEKKAPVLTIFVGGNHEASNYLQELPYGGWVAQDIYYMGYANVVQFGGVRIAGLSGIYKSRDFHKGHYEHPPYNEDTKRSAYHVRNLEVFRLKQIAKPIDIFLSHDWPRGIYNFGDVNGLLRRKQFFREEVETGTLGSPPAEELLFKVKPEYWFAAHLHVKFTALVEHDEAKEDGSKKLTKFLSLDKCLPRRNFLQILDIPHDTNRPLQLELDPEWLCILKSTNHLLHLGKGNRYMPGLGSGERYDFTATEEGIAGVENDFDGVFKVPDNFEKTDPIHDPNQTKRAPAPQMAINPQTTLISEMLDLTNPFAVFSGKQQHFTGETADVESSSANTSVSFDEAEDSDFIDTTVEVSLVNTTLDTTANPDEISLENIDEDEDEDKDSVSSSSAKPESSPVSFPSPISLSERLRKFNPVLNSTPNPFKPDSSPCSDIDEGKVSDEDSRIDSSGIGTPFSLDDSKTTEAASLDSPGTSAQENVAEEDSCKIDSPGKRVGDAPDTSCPETSPPGAKKFKRRNRALYTWCTPPAATDSDDS